MEVDQLTFQGTLKLPKFEDYDDIYLSSET